MREIAMDTAADELPINTYLIYGDTRTGKTVFGATFPRPLIIADVTEGGYQSVRSMDRSQWFEPDVAPVIWGIENMNDLAVISPQLDALIKSKRILSIIVDAFSFYTDFMLAQISKAQSANGKAQDARQIYGMLGTHLREVRQSLHLKGANVLWNCLAKHPDTDDPKGRPLIPGQQADKFAAGVDFLWHSRLEQIRENGVVSQEIYEKRTKQFRSYIAGNRLGINADLLPDPFTGTYRDLLVYRGYDPDSIIKALPPCSKQPVKLQTTATPAPKPPVTNAKPTAAKK